MIGCVGLGLMISGIVIFMISFIFVQFTWSVFFLMVSLGILIVNGGLLIFYVIYCLGRYLIHQIKY